MRKKRVKSSSRIMTHDISYLSVKILYRRDVMYVRASRPLSLDHREQV
jgi:hypothetical protein